MNGTCPSMMTALVVLAACSTVLFSADGDDANVTRLDVAKVAAELVGVIARLSPEAIQRVTMPVDVPNETVEKVRLALAAGLMHSYGDRFDPDREISRFQLAIFVATVVDRLPCRRGDVTVPADVPVEHWAYDAVRLAIAIGAMTAVDGRFRGNDLACERDLRAARARLLECARQPAPPEISPPHLVQDDRKPSKTTIGSLEGQALSVADDLARLNVSMSSFEDELVLVVTAKDPRLPKLRRGLTEVEALRDETRTKLETIRGSLQAPLDAKTSKRAVDNLAALVKVFADELADLDGKMAEFASRIAALSK